VLGLGIGKYKNIINVGYGDGYRDCGRRQRGAGSKSTKFVELLTKKETICVRAKMRELAKYSYIRRRVRVFTLTRLISRILLSAARP